jgi:hypothetical protein
MRSRCTVEVEPGKPCGAEVFVFLTSPRHHYNPRYTMCARHRQMRRTAVQRSRSAQKANATKAGKR